MAAKRQVISDERKEGGAKEFFNDMGLQQYIIFDIEAGGNKYSRSV